MSTITQNSKRASGLLWLALVSALTLVGIGSLIYQIQNGMGVTNLSNLETWGLYVAGFIFFMGISAGSLVLAALPLIFPLPRLQPYVRIAAFTSLAALIAGGLFIMMDIGQPLRLWHLVTYGRLNSPLLWDLLLTIAYLIISTVFLTRLINAERKGAAPSKPLAYVALVAGLADGLTAFVFATQMAHDYWFSSVQPMDFEIAAIISAGSLLLLVLVILNRFTQLKLDLADLKPLTVLMVTLIGLSLLLVVSEVVTLAFGQSESGLALVSWMLASPIFWVENVTFALSGILFLLPRTRLQSGWVVTAAVLALVGLVAKRLLFVALGFAVPNLTYPGVNIGSPTYGPSVVEILLTLGLVGLFALVLTLGLRSTALKPEQR